MTVQRRTAKHLNREDVADSALHQDSQITEEAINRKQSVERKRSTSGSATASATATATATAPATASDVIGIYDILRLVFGLFVVSCALSFFVTGDGLFWGYRPWFTRADVLKAWISGPIVLTDAELAAYDGSDPSKPIYLALNGQIYDVSAGRHFYGPGGSYHFFAGRDGARAFVTGCFQDDLTPDLRGAEEMYIPISENAQTPAEEMEMNGQRDIRAEKEVRKQEKIERERESRLAKKRVQSVIDGWAKTFRGDTGKPYYWVGVVEREDGWLEKLPLRKLCEAAKRSRPKTGSRM